MYSAMLRGLAAAIVYATPRNDSYIAILSYMEVGKKYTITDLIKSVPECADMTNQRVSALVRQMVLDGSVVREEDKRKAYFSKA